METSEAVRVIRVTITRSELTAEKAPALRELFGLAALPLAPARVEVEIAGVPTAAVNALRRAVTDEMPGRALQVPAEGGFDTARTSDLFMLAEFVCPRIALMPLRAQIPAEVVARLRLRLEAANDTASEMAVYAGDLAVAEGAMPEPLFNPTFKLAFLQPGKRLVVEGIHIATGRGRDDGAFLVGRRACLRHLDLPQHEERETHEPDGAAADLSGYKVSSLVANPRHHLLSVVLPAVGPDPGEARAVLVDACANVKERLGLVAAAVEHGEGGARGGVQYTVVGLEAGLSEGVLLVPGETHTIGNLVCRAVYEHYPDIANVAYLCIAHENVLRLTVRHVGSAKEVTGILLGAVRRCIDTFDALQRGIASSRSH
jgi:hypothetical protein